MISRPHSHPPTHEFRQVIFDTQTLNDNILPTIYAQNRPGIVQVFFQILLDNVHTYILDESGSLFTHESKFYDAISLVHQYERFFQSVHQRMQYLRAEGRDNPEQVPAIQYFYIDKGRDTNWQMVQHRSSNMFKTKDYINLQVLGDRIDGELMFTVYCNDLEYSSAEHGESLYQHVANHILQQRKDKEHYPIYITDIDLSKSLLGTDYADVQTIHYLHYKRHFESKLQQYIEFN